MVYGAGSHLQLEAAPSPSRPRGAGRRGGGWRPDLVLFPLGPSDSAGRSSVASAGDDDWGTPTTPARIRRGRGDAEHRGRASGAGSSGDGLTELDGRDLESDHGVAATLAYGAAAGALVIDSQSPPEASSGRHPQPSSSPPRLRLPGSAPPRTLLPLRARSRQQQRRGARDMQCSHAAARGAAAPGLARGRQRLLTTTA
jgi:hypothetical protein